MQQPNSHWMMFPLLTIPALNLVHMLHQSFIINLLPAWTSMAHSSHFIVSDSLSILTFHFWTVACGTFFFFSGSGANASPKRKLVTRSFIVSRLQFVSGVTCKWLCEHGVILATPITCILQHQLYRLWSHSQSILLVWSLVGFCSGNIPPSLLSLCNHTHVYATTERPATGPIWSVISLKWLDLD